jgi:RimJ/RimL family protein N-acetyltransferase
LVIGTSNDDGVRLVSDRLTLREFTGADEQAVHAYAGDRFVTRYMDWGPNSRDETRRFLSEAMAKAAPGRAEFDLAVVHAASGAVIGSVAIAVSTNQQKAEIGYVLHRDFWSQGYATEAAAMLLRFGFDRLNLRHISARCHPDNHASARVLEKVGLNYQRRIPNHLFVRGSWRDSLLYAIDNNA